MSSRPPKDVGGWAASTSTSYDDDDTIRTTRDAAHDDDNDRQDGGGASGEMDWTRLGDILKRGRVKDRISELNKIENLATKGGQYNIRSF